MKKVLSILLAALLLFGVSSLSFAEDAPLRVTASFYPLYVATINIARDVPGIAVDVLAPPSAGCLHDYQMTTDDRKRMENSDVLVLNGAGLESFMDKLLPALEAAKVDASEGIALLAGDHEVNAHVWVSIPGMIAEVRNIADGLMAIDPVHAAQYDANANAYIESLQALYEEMLSALAPFAGEAIVTFHEAFDYFAEDFGLRVVATVQSHHGEAPSARQMASLTHLIQEEGVRALFAEPQYEDTSVDILSRETGVPVYLLDPAVSGEIDPQDYDAYLRIMRQNLQTLVEALQ